MCDINISCFIFHTRTDVRTHTHTHTRWGWYSLFCIFFFCSFSQVGALPSTPRSNLSDMTEGRQSRHIQLFISSFTDPLHPLNNSQTKHQPQPELESTLHYIKYYRWIWNSFWANVCWLPLEMLSEVSEKCVGLFCFSWHQPKGMIIVCPLGILWNGKATSYVVSCCMLINEHLKENYQTDLFFVVVKVKHCENTPCSVFFLG